MPRLRRLRSLAAALTLVAVLAALAAGPGASTVQAECWPEIVWNGEQLVNTGRVNCSIPQYGYGGVSNDPCQWYQSYCAQYAAYLAMHQRNYERSEMYRVAQNSALFRLKNGQACNGLLSGPNGNAAEVLQSIVSAGRINLNGGVYVNPQTNQSEPDTVARISGQGAGGSITIYDRFYTDIPGMMGRDEAGNWRPDGLSVPGRRILALLHEVGHLTGAPIAAHGSSADPAAAQREYHRQILRICFDVQV
jgi:hypothetical protein